MLYLTCSTITSVDLAHYVVSHAKDWVSVDCGTISCCLTRSLAYLYMLKNIAFQSLKKCQDLLLGNSLRTVIQIVIIISELVVISM